jgi:hypothetical protein
MKTSLNTTALLTPLFIFLFVVISVTHAEANFFANSKRRDADPKSAQARSLVRVWCGDHKKPDTGFFVKNAHDEYFIATAQHCASYHFSEYCAAGKIKIETQAGTFKGQCIKPLAMTPEQDAVVFAVDIRGGASRSDVLSQITFLTLSTENPGLNTPLNLIGYPLDHVRRGRMTLSDHCWINNGPPADSFYLKKENDLWMKKPSDPAFTKQTEYIRAHEILLGYNCSVYGGNSGGPVIVAGTTHVIGMPAEYTPYSDRDLPESASSHFYLLQTFLQHTMPSLRNAGIIVQ